MFRSEKVKGFGSLDIGNSKIRTTKASLHAEGSAACSLCSLRHTTNAAGIGFDRLNSSFCPLAEKHRRRTEDSFDMNSSVGLC